MTSQAQQWLVIHLTRSSAAVPPELVAVIELLRTYRRILANLFRIRAV